MLSSPFIVRLINQASSCLDRKKNRKKTDELNGSHRLSKKKPRHMPQKCHQMLLSFASMTIFFGRTSVSSTRWQIPLSSMITYTYVIWTSGNLFSSWNIDFTLAINYIFCVCFFCWWNWHEHARVPRDRVSPTAGTVKNSFPWVESTRSEMSLRLKEYLSLINCRHRSYLIVKISTRRLQSLLGITVFHLLGRRIRHFTSI